MKKIIRSCFILLFTFIGISVLSSCDAKDFNGLEYKILSHEDKTCELVSIGECDDLDITVPEYYGEYKVISIGDYAFYDCRNIKSVTLPEGITRIEAYAFAKCYSLKYLNIPNSISIISCSAFDDSSILRFKTYDNALYLGNEENPYVALVSALNTDISAVEINPQVKVLKEAAFSGCKKLDSVTIPDGVNDIGYWMFSGCVRLKSIYVPNSVTNIDVFAFNECPELSTITFGGTIEDWENVSKKDNWLTNSSSYTVICSDGTLSEN